MYVLFILTITLPRRIAVRKTVRVKICKVVKNDGKEVMFGQGSTFVVAMVANATTFCHLLPGFSSGSKHLLLYCHKFLVL